MAMVILAACVIVIIFVFQLVMYWAVEDVKNDMADAQKRQDSTLVEVKESLNLLLEAIEDSRVITSHRDKIVADIFAGKYDPDNSVLKEAK